MEQRTVVVFVGTEALPGLRGPQNTRSIYTTG